MEKKPPHAVSNRALSTLNKPVELVAEGQEDSDEHTDVSEKYVHSNIYTFKSISLNMPAMQS